MKDLKRYASIIMSFALMALPVAGPLIPVFGAPSESFDHDGSYRLICGYEEGDYEYGDASENDAPKKHVHDESCYELIDDDSEEESSEDKGPIPDKEEGAADASASTAQDPEDTSFDLVDIRPVNDIQSEEQEDKKGSEDDPYTIGYIESNFGKIDRFRVSGDSEVTFTGEEVTKEPDGRYILYLTDKEPSEYISFDSVVSLLPSAILIRFSEDEAWLNYKDGDNPGQLNLKGKYLSMDISWDSETFGEEEKEGTYIFSAELENEIEGLNLSIDDVTVDLGNENTETELKDVSYIFVDGETKTRDAIAVTKNDNTWSDNTYAVRGNIIINNVVMVNGEVNLILMDGSSLTVNGGINVPEGSSFTVLGQEKGTSRLVSRGDDISNDGGGGYAGIGGCGEEESTVNFGYITLASTGTIEAYGGDRSAGIGGGGYMNSNDTEYNGTIKIVRGTVYAKGGIWASGIGAGADGKNESTINISGGDITASCGNDNNAASIGGGLTTDCGNIKISGGHIIAETDIGDGTWHDSNRIQGSHNIFISGGVIEAAGNIGENSDNNGDDDSCVNVDISGGVVFADSIKGKDGYEAANGLIFVEENCEVNEKVSLSDNVQEFEIPDNATLTFNKGGSLELNGQVITNYGTIKVGDGVTPSGQITGDGIIINYGDIDPVSILGEGIKLLGQKSSSAMSINGEDKAEASYGDKISISVNITSANDTNALSRSAAINEVAVYAKRERDDSFLIGTAPVEGSEAELKIKLINDEDQGIYWRPGKYTLTAYYGGGGDEGYTPSEISAVLTVSKGQQSADSVSYEILAKDSEGFTISFSDTSTDNSGRLQIKIEGRDGNTLDDWKDAELGSHMELSFDDKSYARLYLRYAGDDFYNESPEAGPYEIVAQDPEEPEEPSNPEEPTDPENPAEPEEPSHGGSSGGSGGSVSGPVGVYYADGRNSGSPSGITEGSFELISDTENSGEGSEGSYSWRFRLSDGSYARDMWIKALWNSRADWYYIGEDGLIKGGWFTDKDGNIYYLHPYHDGSFGYMYTGDQIIDGVQYHFSTGTEEGLPEGALKRQS